MNTFNEDDYGGIRFNELLFKVRNSETTKEELIEILAKIIIEAYTWEQEQRKLSKNK